MQTRRLDGAHKLAKLEHHGLLRLGHDEQGVVEPQKDDAGEDGQGDQERLFHRLPPGAGALVAPCCAWSWGSGK
ncbi:unnamed protein product [Pararhodospirillum photometricum DSM 122]|uniref:Uncharacterized protein n=1 Tax=Pararhodospirillum photometricum DSM 122 TaxID=1150469 RepID=H6SII0_PARPM|nr:unnamed protein product [Pararhodospirillum photometricum DSM 122]